MTTTPAWYILTRLPRLGAPSSTVVFSYLAQHKRFWVPPIVIVAGLFVYVAYRLSRTPGSPFDYALY